MNNNYALSQKNRKLLNFTDYSGLLIVVEGNDGAGKSTLIKHLTKFLKGEKRKTRVLRFNMSEITRQSIKMGKEKCYGPYVNTLLHLTSLVDQIERQALDALKKGYIVIFDRYVYSIISRGIARGIKPEILLPLCKFVIIPDIVIYLDIDPKIAVERVGINNITFWESGSDMYCSDDKYKNFLLFQSKVRNEFLRYSNDWKFNLVNANISFRNLFYHVLSILEKNIKI